MRLVRNFVWFAAPCLLFIACMMIHKRAARQTGRDTSHSTWQELESFSALDLRKLDSTQRREIESSISIKKLLAKGYNLSYLVHLWKLDEGKRHRIILFEGRPCIPIPGASSASIYVFDPQGKCLSSSSFSTGWRISPTGASPKDASQYGFPVIEVSSAPSGLGGDVAQQYYAFVGDEVALVRLEDSAGSVLRNVYWAPNHTIGPDVPSRTPEEWEAALNANDPADVLRTLVWLGGVHLSSSKEKPKNVDLEKFRDVILVEKVRARDGVQKALRRLVASRDKWIREAAKLAANPESYVYDD